MGGNATAENVVDVGNAQRLGFIKGILVVASAQDNYLGRDDTSQI
jgi:hypothetical protein